MGAALDDMATDREIDREQKRVAAAISEARRAAFDEAIKIIMALTEPGEGAPASYFAHALERARFGAQ